MSLCSVVVEATDSYVTFIHDIGLTRVLSGLPKIGLLSLEESQSEPYEITIKGIRHVIYQQQTDLQLDVLLYLPFQVLLRSLRCGWAPLSHSRIWVMLQ